MNTDTLKVVEPGTSDLGDLGDLGEQETLLGQARRAMERIRLMLLTTRRPSRRPRAWLAARQYMWAAAAQGPLTYHLWERVEIRKPATPRKTGQEVLVPVRGGVHEWRPVIKRPDILVVLQTPLCGYLKDSAGNPTGIPTWRKRLQRLPTERYATTREDLACRDCYQAYITSRSRSERKAAATAMTLGKAA